MFRSRRRLECRSLNSQTCEHLAFLPGMITTLALVAAPSALNFAAAGPSSPSRSSSIVVLLMDKILHYPLQGIYHNSHSLGSLGSCRILSISSTTPSIQEALAEEQEAQQPLVAPEKLLLLAKAQGDPNPVVVESPPATSTSTSAGATCRRTC